MRADAQQLLARVPVGQYPRAVAVDSLRNKIYVGNTGDDNTVTVIDGNTFATVSVPVSGTPGNLAVNKVTNKVYVLTSTALAVIDGATLNVTEVGIAGASNLAINEITNKIYVSAGFVIVVDGETLSMQTLNVYGSNDIVSDQRNNKVYLSYFEGGAIAVIDGANNSFVSVSTGTTLQGPLAVDTYANKIYALSFGNYPDGLLTIVDGSTLALTNLTIHNGFYGDLLAIDERTHKAFIPQADNGGCFVVVVDGTTLSVSTVELPLTIRPYFYNIGFDAVSNYLYLNAETYSDSGVLMIQGSNYAITYFSAGGEPFYGMAIDTSRTRIYWSNNDSTVSAVAGITPLRLVPVPPCRVVDTRLPNGPLGGPPIRGGTERDFPLPQGQCGIPANASAYSLNATVVPHQHLGYLTVWPTGETQPNVSTMNSVDGRVKANAAIVPAGLGGSVSVYASDTTDVILDINGYFASANAMALAYYPLNSCRVVDTRGPNGPYLTGGQERDFPILGACDIPSTAQAYALNVTALPHHHLGYLTVWPEGQQQPLVSTLNAPTGATTANAALVTAGTDGEIAVYPSDDTDLLIDVNGYFAPLGPGGMSLYTVLPCRALDTRQGRGAFSGITLVDMVDSGCNVNEAEAYVLNATVVPRGPLGYLTIWPTTEFMPPTSTLNAADGVVTSNLAIVPNIDGWLDVFASNPTNLIIDAFGYFAP